MKTTEKVLGLIIVVGIMMGLFMIRGRGLALICGCGFLAVFYNFLSFAYFNNIRFRDILKKESYSGVSALRIIGTIVLGFSLATTVIAFLFKFMFYKGGQLMLLEGIFYLLICLVVSFIRYKKTKSSNYRKIFSRIAIIGGFALLLSLIPGMTFFEMLHRNNPEYVQAVKNLDKDPNNQALKDEVESAKGSI